MSSPAGGGCGLIDGGADERAESESELLSCNWSMVNELIHNELYISYNLSISACVHLNFTFILSSCILALWRRSSALAVCVVVEVTVVVVHMLSKVGEFVVVACISPIRCSSIAATLSGFINCSRALGVCKGAHLVVVAVFSKLLQFSLCVVVVAVVVVIGELMDGVMLLL